MDSSIAIDLARQALLTTGVLMVPVLAASFIIGVVMSLLQAVTQVQDHAISFVPKLVAIGLALCVCAPWMTDVFVQYARELITQIPTTIFGGI